MPEDGMGSTTARPLHLKEFICDDCGVILVSRVLRFEHLAVDIGLLVQELIEVHGMAIRPGELSHLEPSPKPFSDYREEYNDPAVIRRVREIFWEDLDTFSYDF